MTGVTKLRLSAATARRVLSSARKRKSVCVASVVPEFHGTPDLKRSRPTAAVLSILSSVRYLASLERRLQKLQLNEVTREKVFQNVCFLFKSVVVKFVDL